MDPEIHRNSGSEDGENDRTGENLLDDVRRLMLAGRSLLFDSITDMRFPAPDVKGIMCDRQIRQPQIEVIRQLVERDWPGVCAICFGYDSSQAEFYCSICLDPFSQTLQRAHWLLGDRIEEIIGMTERISFFFPPKMELGKFSSEVEIFHRSPAPEVPASNPA